MTIAIIGAGNVGAALGEAFRKAGETVIYGVRDPVAGKYAPLRDAGHTLKRPAEAVASASTILLAVPWIGIADTIAGLGDVSGKIIIDATNPIKADFSDIDPSPDRSAGEAVARLAPGAKVAKAFNTMTSFVMSSPDYGHTRAALAIATDNDAARTETERLGRAIGFEPYNAGPLAAARETERMAWHVINMAVIQGQGRYVAFAFLNKAG